MNPPLIIGKLYKRDDASESYDVESKSITGARKLNGCWTFCDDHQKLMKVPWPDNSAILIVDVFTGQHNDINCYIGLIEGSFVMVYPYDVQPL